LLKAAGADNPGCCPLADKPFQIFKEYFCVEEAALAIAS
jgi:hypothetical protein